MPKTKKERPMEEVESKKGKFKIPQKLSMQERAAMADKLSALDMEQTLAMDEYSGHRKHYTYRMTELKEKQEEVLGALNKGFVEKEVSCEQVFFHAQGIVRFVDLKSKTKIFERPMTPEEREPTFFPDPPKEKCVKQICKNCNEEWFGGENNALCWNCKKTEAYRFAKGT